MILRVFLALIIINFHFSLIIPAEATTKKHIVEDTISIAELWSYEDDSETGPLKWHSLPGFQQCAGEKQSPININLEDTKSTKADLKFYNYEDYTVESLHLVNDGHTVKIEFNYEKETEVSKMPSISGSHLDGVYKLMNIHFHWGSESHKGSEHEINGRKFPIEVHLVHIKATLNSLEEAIQHADGISVVGALYSISHSRNKSLKSILSHLGQVKYKNDKREIEKFNLFHLLPRGYEEIVVYDGSLTTPPCSEAVKWNVLKNQNRISESQMKMFRRLQRDVKIDAGTDNKPLVNNFRPIQDLNKRPLYHSEVKS